MKKGAIKSTTIKALKEIMRPDYVIYNHFRTKLESEIEKFGNKKMIKELMELEEVNTEVREKCNFILAENNDLPRNSALPI